MDCVLVAGGRPDPDDPLYPLTRGAPKALLDIGGRPLVDYMLDALLQAQSVDHVVVVGLEDGPHGEQADGVTVGASVTVDGDVSYVADQGGMVANGLAGLALIRRRRPDTRHVLFASADIPAATGPMIDDILARYQPFDKGVYYFMVDKRVLEASYPGSNRTYVRLKDLEVAGADIFIADALLADGNVELLTDLSAGRKQAWKMARLAGPSTILSLLLRRMTLDGIERRASKVIGAPVSVTLIDRPELAMDVDKPQQLDLLRALMP